MEQFPVVRLTLVQSDIEFSQVIKKRLVNAGSCNPIDDNRTTVERVSAPSPIRVSAPSARRAASPRAAPGSKAKAAFTLRLDPVRHLKLRLACAVTGRSAQLLVTDALDALLAGMPELDGMAERAPAARKAS